MSTLQKLVPEQDSPYKAVLWIGAGLIITGGMTLAALALLVLGQAVGLGGLFTWLLALDSTQVTWYVTRAAGLTAYLLLWFSTAWGLAVPSRILDGILHGSFTFDFHEFTSLLAIAFTALHLGVLLFDSYQPFSLVQILLPFVSQYRPLWVGTGVISFYLVLLVTITFYLRGRIGMKAFRVIHLLSLVSFVGVALHGLFAGTDSPLPAVQVMYGGTTLSIVFLLTYWLTGQAMKKRLPTRVRP